jgi:uncharacterized membrane protein
MLEIILTLTDALVGTAIENAERLVVGGLVGLLSGLVLSTRLRVKRQARDLEALRARLDAIAAELPPVELDLDLQAVFTDAQNPQQNEALHADAAEPTPATIEAVRPQRFQSKPGEFTGVTSDGDVKPADPARAQAAASSTAADAPRDASNPLADAFNAAVTFIRNANTMVLVGVVVLFFGFAFLAKLAIDADLVPIEMRLAGIAGVGIALLIAGWRFRHERRTFGLPLQGGGTGIMFLTVFAAYRLYEVIPAELCFGLLVLLVLFGVLLAVLQNAPAMASLAVSGGFLAPVLASTGSGDHVMLFSYYLLLNLGILAIAWFKAWRILNLLGFLFTFIIGTLWGAQYYRPALFSSTEPFVLAHFVLYTTISILFAARQPTRLRGLVDGTLVFGTPLVVFALQSQLASDFEFGLAWSAVAGAAFYIGLATFLSRQHCFRLLLEAFVANGVVLATIAVPLALDARWTSVTWALEGAGVLWVGVRQGRRFPRFAGSLLQLLAGVAWLIHVEQHALRDAAMFANAQFLGGVLIAAAGLFCGAYLHQAREHVQPYERWLAGLLGSWALLWWYAGGLWELAQRAPSEANWGALLLFLAVSIIAFAWLYGWLHWAVLRVVLLGHVVLLMLTGLAMGLQERQPFAGMAWLGWPAAALGQLVALRKLDHWQNPVRSLVHAGLLWVITLVAAWAAGYWLDRWLGGRNLWEPVAFGLIPAMAVIVVGRASGGERWPIGVYATPYLRLACGPIAALLVVWVWLVNLSQPGSEWPIAYLPILNPIDVANGFALIAVLAWLRRCSQRFEDWLKAPAMNSARAVLAATVFVWANAVLFRSIHFWADIAYDSHSLWHADITQSSLAILWSVLGVSGMWIGARKHLRIVWFVAASLMGVVVLKLFFVDLANTGTLERVISFVSVGLLMVLVGYFAPVPPRASAHKHQAASTT